MKSVVLAVIPTAMLLSAGLHAQAGAPAPAAVPTDVLPGSITCEDVPYPFPTSYLPLTMYGQDVRMAYMDVPAAGTPNGRTVVLLHGFNFAGFYWGGPIEALRQAGFRVVVPDQIGFGRSSKPILPYTFHDMALNTRRLLMHLNIPAAAIVGHSMGGMLAARFATQYPEATERLVIYNPIGLVDARFDRVWTDTDENYRRTLGATYQTVRAGLMRYFSHNPSAWPPEMDRYARIRYAWTLSADWPRLAMVQTLIQQAIYFDQVVDDWAHITAPTLAIGGAEDSLVPNGRFRERMKVLADSIPGGKGRLVLLPGLGHVPHVEAPAMLYPPLLAFLSEGTAIR